MTSIPASRSARAMIFAPRSCPSSPGFAMTTLIFRATVASLVSLRASALYPLELERPDRPLLQLAGLGWTERRVDGCGGRHGDLCQSCVRKRRLRDGQRGRHRTDRPAHALGGLARTAARAQTDVAEGPKRHGRRPRGREANASAAEG